MKTPHAILIGLSLIAAAIFFKDIMTPPAHARWTPETTSPALSCPNWHWCYVLDNKTIARIKVSDYEKVPASHKASMGFKRNAALPLGLNGLVSW